jgi:hypothetical protein
MSKTEWISNKKNLSMFSCVITKFKLKTERIIKFLTTLINLLVSTQSSSLKKKEY